MKPTPQCTDRCEVDSTTGDHLHDQACYWVAVALKRGWVVGRDADGPTLVPPRERN